MCSMGSPRQRRDVTHDGAGVSTEHASNTHGDSRPHVRVHPKPRCPPLHPWRGSLNFGAGWGQSQSPPYQGEEEDG